MPISHRIPRPTSHHGGSRGITKWQHTRIMDGRITLFEIIHDAALRETTIRTYPGAGWTPPTHAFTVHGLTARDVARRIHAA